MVGDVLMRRTSPLRITGGLGSMDKIFKKFDSSNDGQLNLLEFSTAVEEFGYARLAHDLLLAPAATHPAYSHTPRYQGTASWVTISSSSSTRTVQAQ